MTRVLNQESLDAIKRWEGFRAEAYPDPGSRDGKPVTIGYGTTLINGRPIALGTRITMEEAEIHLRKDLEAAAAAVERAVKVPLTDNQFGALVSFTYNVGIGAFQRSTLLRRLNAGEYDAVPSELARWKYNDGKVMQGLINRRAAEAGLWARESFVSSNHVKAEPAKAPSAVDTLLKDPGGLSGLGAGIAALLGAIANQPILQVGAVLLIGVLVWRFVIARKERAA